jgi:hypothetical protein
MTNTINAEIDVNAYYFAGKEMKSFPRRISYGGRAVTFADGLRLQLQREGRLTYLYDMSSDDGATYRLRQDGNQWTLVGTR